jgi:hypothetical protein
MRIQELASFDFDSVDNSGEMEVTLAEHVGVGQATMATLMVRAHSGTIPSGATLEVIAYPDGHTMEDPATEFQGGTSLGSVTLTNTTTATGVYATDELTAGSMGSMINVVLKATQASQAASFDARISVDLSLKW